MSFPGEVGEQLRQQIFIEADVAATLLAFATRLLRTYDLGTARNQVWKGDAEKKGRVTFERYISLRSRCGSLKLVAINFHGEGLGRVRYQIFGPKRLLTKFRTLRELRPYLLDDEVRGTTTGGEEYDSFETAAERFTWLVDKLCGEVETKPFGIKVLKNRRRNQG